MLFTLLHLLYVGLAVAGDFSHGAGAGSISSKCSPLPSLDAHGQYQGVVKTFTITKESLDKCTRYVDLEETNYCGAQQIQAYAYQTGTKHYAETDYVRIFVAGYEDAVANDKGAYTAHTFLSNDHVSGKAIACTSFGEGVESIDLTLRVIYWP